MISKTRPDGVVQILDRESYERDHPEAVIGQCGTCHRMWDDSKPTMWTPTPSGRCPFEYDHEYRRPEVTPVSPADELAARIPPHKAQLVLVKAIAAMGAHPEWDSGTGDRVMDQLAAVFDDLGCTTPELTGPGDVPNPYSMEEASSDWWKQVLES
jgi:hypothetical protein